jgi:hypothetical protein
MLGKKYLKFSNNKFPYYFTYTNPYFFDNTNIGGLICSEILCIYLF